MSYEVLARKWRPQTFDEVVGQDHITRTLKKAVELGRLSHAYLLSGPRGSGKTSTARILAKVINCVALENGNPCNKCDSCGGVAKGKNLDVMEIDGASHTGVGEVRDLQESIGYVPSQFKNKIYIIDEVHMLSTHAFNALLKTLEEPPAHVYFIFATTAPHKIPDTIKSRCQRHQFKRIEIRDIADHLEKMCNEEKVKFEKDALRLLGRKAEGSMRDGQSLLDQCITASSGDVKTQAVREILGLLDQELVLVFLRKIAEGDSGGVLAQLDGAIHEGVDLEELLNALIEGFRDLMLLATPGDLDDLVFRTADELESMRGPLEMYELADLVTIVERLCNLSPRLKIANDPRILLESVLVDLSLLDRQVNIRELIDTLEGSGLGPGPTQKRPAQGAPKTGKKTQSAAHGAKTGGDRPVTVSPAARTGAFAEKPGIPDDPVAKPSAPRHQSEDDIHPKDVDLGSMDYAGQRRLWDSFVTYVRQKKVALGVCLISGTLHSIDKNVVTLRFAKGFSFQKDQVENPANQNFLKDMTKKYFGRDFELVCSSAGETKPASAAARQKGNSRGGKPGIETNPIVKKILAEFDGEIERYHQ